MPAKDAAIEPKVNDQNDVQPGASINNNPCGICRAAGMPVCKGHGGGSMGGGESSANDELQSEDATLKTSSPSPQFQTILSSKRSIDEVLSQSSLWTQLDPLESNFQYNNPDSLISIELQAENLVLAFRGHDHLTTDQQKERNEFFMAVEKEFKLFKETLSTLGVTCKDMTLNSATNQLSITIPSPKYYDAFLERLMSKNLLNTQVSPAPTMQEKKEAQADLMSRQTSEESTEKSTAPNPFHTTLKPKGWDS